MEQSEWVRKLNNHGQSVGTPRFLVNINGKEMIETAKTISGLSDFGDDNWKKPYEDYIERLNELDQLHTLGRIRLKTALIIALRNRLLITEKIKNIPNIIEQSIDNPLFITGLPRTGTTLLYALLSLDEKFRTPYGYEAVLPVSQPDTYLENITRNNIAECIFDFEIDIHKQVEAMHDHRQNLPIECQNIMTNVLALFYSETIGDSNPPPESNYFIPDYHWHRKVLQVLQFKDTKKTWLLKCPAHINTMKELIDVYPNSSVIHTHRNPISVIPSCAKLLKYLTDSHCKNDNFTKTLDSFINNLEIGLKKVIEQRNTSIIKKQNIHDSYFEDLLADPVSTVEKIYEKFDIPFNGNKRKNILTYLKHNPRFSKGKYSCTFEEFGLSKKEIMEKFRFYTDYYGIQ